MKLAPYISGIATGALVYFTWDTVPIIKRVASFDGYFGQVASSAISGAIAGEVVWFFGL